jgi:hypothetical protein
MAQTEAAHFACMKFHLKIALGILTREMRRSF